MKNSVRLPAAFHRLSWSNLAAQMAEQIALAATPFVAVLIFDADASASGWIQTAQTLPFLLVAIPAGLLVDRFSSRAVMMWAEFARTLSLLAVLALLISGHLDLFSLAALGFIGASATVFFTVAAPAIIPSLVSVPLLTRANSRIELAKTSAYAAGPVAAGLLFTHTSAVLTYGVTVVLSIMAFAVLRSLPTVARQQRHAESIGQELREGLHYVARHRYLRPIFVTQFIFSMAMFMVLAVYVPYASHHLQLDASQIGITMGFLGAGMLTGIAFSGAIFNAVPFGLVIAIGPICGVLSSLVMLTTLWVASISLASLSFFLLGIGPILWSIYTTTLRQQVTPKALLGRVSAINVLAFGARPLGAAVAALVAIKFGAAGCLAVAALLFLLQAVHICRSVVVKLPSLPTHDETAINLTGRVPESRQDCDTAQ